MQYQAGVNIDFIPPPEYFTSLSSIPPQTYPNTFVLPPHASLPPSFDNQLNQVDVNIINGLEDVSTLSSGNNVHHSTVPTVSRREPKIKGRRTGQATNEVSTHLRTIIKEHGRMYDSSRSRTWQDLCAQVVEQNLWHLVDPKWATWIIERNTNPPKKKSTTKNLQEIIINNTPSDSSSVHSPQSNLSSPDPNSSPYSLSSPISPSSSSPPVHDGRSDTSSPSLEFIEKFLQDNNSSSSLVGDSEEIQTLLKQPPPSSSLPLGDRNYKARKIQAESVEVEDVRAHRILCNAFACLSDERTKNNIRKLTPEESLGVIRQLRACVFRYLEEYNGGDDRDVRGFIAQEVHKICPDLVEITSTGIMTVRTLEIIPLVCDAIRVVEDKYEELSEKVSRMNLTPCGPMLLAYFENNKLQINPQALDVLRDIKLNITVLSVCGEGGDGNSTLCNLLLGSKDTDRYFATGNTTERCTKDIWMSYPMKHSDPKKGDFVRIVIDCQGYDIGDKCVQILSFLCLISTTMLICQNNILNNNLFEKFKSMVEVQKLFQKYKLATNELPSLIMLIRDAELERDKNVDGVHQLDNLLDKSDADLQKAINQFAPRTVLDLHHPRHADFQKSFEALRTNVARYCAPRRASHASPASRTQCASHGASLAHRIESAAQVLRDNLSDARVPSFSQLVQCRSVAEEVLSEYSVGKLRVSEVISAYDERTKEIPSDYKQADLKQLQKKIKVQELLYLVDDCEWQLKKETKPESGNN